MDLILASTSPYRRTLLERLGIPFRSIAPPIDEENLKSDHPGDTPRGLAERLARAKAASIASIEPDAVVIGGDQLVSFEGAIIGKPGTTDGAIAQLRAMSGLRHDLITAICVIHRGIAYAHTDVTTMTFRALTLDEIRRYIEFDGPLDSAGSYKLESRGIVLFERIESADHSAITGIPLIALTSILRSIGFEIP